MSIKPRGHYGLNKLYEVAGHPVGYRIRTEDRELFYAGRYGEKKPYGNGIFLFSRRLPARFAKLGQLNEDCETRNRAVISGLPKEKPCVLYVLDFLFKTGGVERRLALQFKWLMAHGIEPVLVVEKQDYEPLKDYPCLFLTEGSPVQLFGRGGFTIEPSLPSAPLSELKPFSRMKPTESPSLRSSEPLRPKRGPA